MFAVGFLGRSRFRVGAVSRFRLGLDRVDWVPPPYKENLS